MTALYQRAPEARRAVRYLCNFLCNVTKDAGASVR